MLFAAVTGWATPTMMMLTMMMMTMKHHFQPYHFFFSVGTPLAWWLLAWRGHLPDTHPNHGHPGNPLLLHPQTVVPFTFPHFLDIKAGIFTSGNATCHYKYLWNRKKQTPPSYIALLLPVSFHCLLVHRSSTSCTLCPKFLAPTIPDTTAFSSSGVHHVPRSIASWYRQSPVVPAAPFIHNSMVSYGISRMWHQPSSGQEKRHWQHPFTWRARSVTTPVCLSCFLFITNVNLNAFTLENGYNSDPLFQGAN